MAVPDPFEIPISRLPAAPAGTRLQIGVPDCAAGLDYVLADFWAREIIRYYEEPVSDGGGLARRWKWRAGLSRKALGLVQFYASKVEPAPGVARRALAHALNVFDYVDTRTIAGQVAATDGRGYAKSNRPTAAELAHRFGYSVRTIKSWRGREQYRAIFRAMSLPGADRYKHDRAFGLTPTDIAPRIVAGMAGTPKQRIAAKRVAFMLINSQYRHHRGKVGPLVMSTVAIALGVVTASSAT